MTDPESASAGLSSSNNDSWSWNLYPRQGEVAENLVLPLVVISRTLGNDVSVTVTQPWKCVDGSSSSTDASASGGPWEVWPTCGEEIFDSDRYCCDPENELVILRRQDPDYPTHSGGPKLIAVADKQESGSEVHMILPGQYRRYIWNVTATERSEWAKFEIYSHRESGDCGMQVSPSPPVKWSGASMSISAQVKLVTIGTSFTWGGGSYQPFVNSQATPYVWQYATVWKESRMPHHAKFVGAIDIYRWPNGELLKSDNVAVHAFYDGEYEVFGYPSEINLIPCCL